MDGHYVCLCDSKRDLCTQLGQLGPTDMYVGRFLPNTKYWNMFVNPKNNYSFIFHRIGPDQAAAAAVKVSNCISLLWTSEYGGTAAAVSGKVVDHSGPTDQQSNRPAGQINKNRFEVVQATHRLATRLVCSFGRDTSPPDWGPVHSLVRAPTA